MKPVSAARYAFGYKRTLDHLRAWQLVLPRAVREVVVSLSLRGKRHSGTRYGVVWLLIHVIVICDKGLDQFVTNHY